MDDLSVVQRFVVWSLPLIFAITVHEVAHGWMALRLGDKTAKMLGRLTLNPLKHIDPVGTILLPGILLLLGGFIFGWAKPVPITQENLKNPKRDMIFVALAGPGANLLMAIFWALVAKVGIIIGAQTSWLSTPMIYMGSAGIFINLILMVLNLLPLPPLDGGRVVSGLLPNRLSWKFDQIERYGFFILIGLLATGMLGKIIGPPIFFLQAIISKLIGI